MSDSLSNSQTVKMKLLVWTVPRTYFKTIITWKDKHRANTFQKESKARFIINRIVIFHITRAAKYWYPNK